MERHRESIVNRFFGTPAGRALIARAEDDHRTTQDEERQQLATERRALVAELDTVGRESQKAVAKADAAVVTAEARLAAAKRARDEAERVRMVQTSVLEGRIQRIDGRLKEASPTIDAMLKKLDAYARELRGRAGIRPYYDGTGGWKIATNKSEIDTVLERLGKLRVQVQELVGRGLADKALEARLAALWNDRPQGGYLPAIPASSFAAAPSVLPV